MSDGPIARATYLLRRHVVTAAVLLTVLVIIGLPVLRLFILSFREGTPFEPGGFTVSNYDGIVSNPRTTELLMNTLLFAAGQTLLSLVVGVGLAWLVTRTNVPFKRLWEFAVLSLFFVPFLVAAAAWQFLLAPRTGYLNRIIQDLTPFNGFNIYSLGGMILVQSLYLVPLVYLMMSAAFRSINPEIEAAARVCGARPSAVFFRVTLGVTRPAVLSAGLLCFIFGIGSVEVPLLFGFPNQYYVLTTQIYNLLRIRFPAEWSAAAAYAMLLVAIVMLLLYVYQRATRRAVRYVTVTGKGQAASLIQLGRWKWPVTSLIAGFFLFAAVLPFATLVVASLLPYGGAFSWELLGEASLDNYRTLLDGDLLRRAVVNSLFISLFASSALSIVGAISAYLIVRRRNFATRFLEFMSGLSLAVPSLVLSYAFLLTFIGVQPFGLRVYGTTLIIGFAYLAIFLPITVRQLLGPMFQISPELEHAARVCGATPIRSHLLIVLPLIRNALFGAFILSFVFLLREFSASVLLYVHGTEVISIAFYSMLTGGQTGAAAALGVIFASSMMILVSIMYRFANVRVGF